MISKNKYPWREKYSWFIRDSGYVLLYVDSRKVYEHRWIMEQSLGRKLLRKEFVHHKNGSRHDNRIDNLELMSNAQHSKHHNSGENNGNYGKRGIEMPWFGKRGFGTPMYGKRHSLESRIKMSCSQKRRYSNKS